MGKKRSHRISENESSARDSDINDEVHVARALEEEQRDLVNEEKEFQQVPAYRMSESQFVLAILCLSVAIYVMISSSAPVPAYSGNDTLWLRGRPVRNPHHMRHVFSRFFHSFPHNKLYETKKTSYSAPNPVSTQQSRDVKNSSQMGGWRAADEATVKNYYSDTCNIIRKPSSKINSKKFDREYRHMKPVIIQFPEGAGSWIQPEMWSLSQLLQTYGNGKVKYGSSIDLAYENDKSESDLSLADFTRTWMHSDMKNHSLIASVKLPERITNGTFRVPKFLNITAGFSDGSFSVGPSGSGVAFRRVPDVWNGVVYGQQRWFLYAPDTTPRTGYWPGVEVTHWVDSFSRRGVVPMECVLNPGDILYVPGWWYSSFINLGDTLAVHFLNHAPQDSFIGNLSSRLDAVSNETGSDLGERTRLEQTFSTLLQLHEMFPSNTEFINRLGENYAARGDFASGIATTLDAVTLDADFLVAHLNLGKMYFATGRYAEAEKHFQRAAEINPTNADLCGLFGEYLVYRKRVQEGIRWFQRGASHHRHKTDYFMTLANQAREILNADPVLSEVQDAPPGSPAV